MKDEDIIELYFSRSEKAIEETDKKYGASSRSISMNILGNRQDAEECVNDAYLGVWNTIPPQRPNPFCTYLFKVVRNRSISRFHANSAQKRNSHYDVALEELEGCLSCGSTVDEEMERKELTALLDKFLGQQDQKTRIMFVRRYWFGDSVAVVAAHFSMKPNAVSVHLLRTRSRLRAFLEKEGYFV